MTKQHQAHRPHRARIAVATACAVAATLLGSSGAAWSSSARGAVVVNESAQVWLTTTSGSNLATTLAQQASVTFGAPTSQAPSIDITSTTSYQTIDGFGGAMTDSAAWLIYNSPQRAAIMNDLFSGSGAQFNFLRLPMGASDLSLSNYSYDAMPAGQTDPSLANFSVSHDTSYIIPLLQQARNLAPDLKINATPWSAPGWMKIGDSYVGSCSGANNYLNPSYYTAYANYFAKFVQAYQGYNLPIYMVSMQNEPRNCNGTYGTMNMEPADQANFATKLRTALNNSGASGTKILGWDHNWYENGNPTGYPQALIAANAGAVDAIGYHCYDSPDGAYSVQSAFRTAYPSEQVYFTECTGGGWATNHAANFVWELKNNLIGPVRNWARASTYFSLALDPSGGPTVGGCDNCRGMLTVNNSNGTYTKNEDYYAWAHFSKFVDAGAVRVASTDLASSGLSNVAFRNPDGSIVLVALNSNGSSKTFQVKWDGKAFEYTLPANSVATFTWKPGTGTANPATSISSTAWYEVVNQNSGKCVDTDGWGTANGTVVQQWTCAATLANNQQWQFQPTSSGYYKVVNRHAPAQVWDLIGGSAATANAAKMETWTYGGGTNQQWMPVPLGNGYWKFVARNSAKCLDVTGASTANGTQLQQWTCSGGSAQSFQLLQVLP